MEKGIKKEQCARSWAEEVRGFLAQETAQAEARSGCEVFGEESPG